MRSRQMVTGPLLALCALLAVSPVDQAAASATTKVVSRVGLPTSFSLADVDSAPDTCTATPGTATATHVVGPGSPPLGLGSLALSFTAGAELTDSFAAAASSLTTFTVSSLGSPTQAHALILADLPNGGGYELTSELALGDGWTSKNILNDSQLIWWLHESGGFQWDQTGQGTYATFVADNPGVQLTGIAITGDTCSVGNTYSLNIDDLTVGVAGKTTRYDFEAPLLADSLTARISTAATTSGGPVTARATLQHSGKPIPNASVALWQKPAGSPAYREVGVIKTGSTGVATAPVQHPILTTSYQWRFTTDRTYASAHSATSVVRVARKITLNLATLKVGADKPVIASGVLSPKRSRTTVTLWRVKGPGKVKIGSTKARRDGSYVISKVLPAGRYHVFVTTRTDPTNTAGRSPTRKILVE